jgi:hypothetical protein
LIQSSVSTYEAMSDSLIEEIEQLDPEINPDEVLLLHHSQLSDRSPTNTLKFVIGLIQCLRGEHPEAPWHGPAPEETLIAGKARVDAVLCSALKKLSIEPDDEECTKLRKSSIDMLYSAQDFMKDYIRHVDCARIAYAIQAVLKNEWRDPLDYFGQDDGPLRFVYDKDKDWDKIHDPTLIDHSPYDNTHAR